MIDLSPHIAEIARRLLGPENRQHSQPRHGQLRFGNNGSVAVEITGPKQGQWYDHEEGVGGGPLDLLRIKGGLVNNEAIDWLRSNGFDLQPAGERRHTKIEHTYDYCDESGALLYQVVRVAPKGFRQRRPDGNGGWVWKLSDTRRVPYRLPELIATPAGTTIYIPEGEKDVQRLRSHGVAATCNSEGAGKWRGDFARWFKGRDVVVLPDNDEPGRQHADDIAKSLKASARSVQIINLPGLPPKGDVSDWLDAGGTVEELRRLSDRAEAEFASSPTGDWLTQAQRDSQGEPRPNLVNAMLALRGDENLAGCLAYDEMLRAPILCAPVPGVAPERLFQPRPVRDVDFAAIQEYLLMTGGTTPPHMIDSLRTQLGRTEEEWNATVFAGRQQGAPGIVAACRDRQRYVRRFDPVRMVVEHETLLQEKLHGGQLSDGKEVSVDVTILDPFLIPDGLSELQTQQLREQVRRRITLLGIAEMRLVRDVRICEYTFAYSRTSSSPTVRRDKAGDAELPVRLRLFDRVEVGDTAKHPVLCLVQSNEGFYVRLDEETVLEWLAANGIAAAPAVAGVRLGGRLIEEFAALDADPTARFSRFLDEYRRERGVARLAYPYVYTLLHTLAHHLIGVCASMSGLDIGSFGEHIFAPDLAFLVYRRGMTMDLGNLSSMWRDRGDPAYGNEVLEQMVSPLSLRCGSESVCNHRGGACPDCVLIPESACLTRNELLSRSVLIGRGAPRWDAVGARLTGYYEIAAQRAAAAA